MSFRLWEREFFLFRQAEGSLFGRGRRAKWELIFEKKKRAPKAKRGKALLGAIWRAFSVSSFLCFFLSFCCGSH